MSNHFTKEKKGRNHSYSMLATKAKFGCFTSTKSCCSRKESKLH